MCKQNHQRLLVEKEMRHLTIEWKGPFTIDEVRGMKNSRNDYGLYQIYGEHIIFGKDSLLYIGRATKGFSYRFNQHWENWIQYDIADRKDVSIYIARVSRKDIPPKVLDDAEALQIHWHSPPYNAKYIESLGKEREKEFDRNPLEIVNEGERRCLVEWLSTKRLPWTPERLR